MHDNRSRPPHEPWANGWAQDTTRAPGTRRLWPAGALALATVVACATTIAVNREGTRDTSRTAVAPPEATVPGLISFATPPEDTASPARHRQAPASPRPTTVRPRPGVSADAGAPAPARSVRSVNYPDRYWQISEGHVRLDPVNGPADRENSTFKLVKGLAEASCYSFATHDGGYLRHRDFLLRAERDDGSALFRQDATFCPRASAFPGAVMLESVNYPGRFLRHEDFRLKLEPWQNGELYRQDSAFRLVDGLA
ncbi:AbfB domain-containing protein [Streptomyces sp. H51]|uniref:AbfB domain-containing protein n=1 Tax=Streptomyces sp. H51 TaxID=3111770 RepID=UPI002D78E825|nr:AbfB domain-containing protein [Streptomyces sp. H51]